MICWEEKEKGIPVIKNYSIQSSSKLSVLSISWFHFIEKLINLEWIEFACDNLIKHALPFLNEKQQIHLLSLFPIEFPLFKFKVSFHSQFHSIRESTMKDYIQLLKNPAPLSGNSSEICDISICKMILMHYSEFIDDVIQNHSFFNSLIEFLQLNTIWTTPLATLRSASFSKNGSVHCCLPFIVAKLMLNGSTENAAFLLSQVMEIPEQFNSWSNSTFILSQFLKVHSNPDKWNKSKFLKLSNHSECEPSADNQWDDCVELCKKSLSLLP